MQTLTPLPPAHGDPPSFDARADAFLAALPSFLAIDPPVRELIHPGSLSAFGTAAFRRWLWRRG